jgi:hypothetical protein
MAELDAGWRQSRMTKSGALPPSIAALRKAYSITSSAHGERDGLQPA